MSLCTLRREMLKVCVAGLIGAGGLAQAAPTFEKASISPSQAGPSERQWWTRSWRVDIVGASLRELIESAYQVKPKYLVVPEWMNEARFDVSAVLPEGVQAAQVPEMLQGLLAERFRLRLHKEMRPQPVYLLRVVEGGLKLEAAAAGAQQASNTTSGGTEMTGTLLSFATLRAGLSALDRPLVDGTELKGLYRGVIPAGSGLERMVRGQQGLTPADERGQEAWLAQRNRDLASLGLRIENSSAPAEVLVGDSAERIPIPQP